MGLWLLMVRELQRFRSAGAGAFLEEIWRGDFYFHNIPSQKSASLLALPRFGLGFREARPADGAAEFWTGTQWKAAPRPLVFNWQ